MTRDAFQEQLSAYIDDELAPAERLAVEQHLTTCSECRAEVAALSALLETLRGLPSIPAPAGVEAPAMELVARRAAFGASVQGLIASFRRNTRSYALAGSALAATAIALLILPVERPPPSRPKAPRLANRPAPAKAVEVHAIGPSAPPLQVPKHSGARRPGPREASQQRSVTEPTIVAESPAPPPSDGPGGQQPVVAMRAVFQAGGARAAHARMGGARGAPDPSNRWEVIAAASTDSVAQINTEWRLYDGRTGKAVFQKVLRNRQGNVAIAFVRLRTGRTVRWLTLDDEPGRSVPVRGVANGQGMLVDATGDVLTVRTLVAGWTAPFESPAAAAVIFDEGAAMGGSGTDVALDAAELRDAEAWIPQSGGYLFATDAPVRLSETPKPFAGRNLRFSVVLTGSDEGANARVASLSAEEDLARLRISPPPPVRPMALAPGEPIPIGGQVLVLGGVRLLAWRLAHHADDMRAQIDAITAATSTGRASGSEADATSPPETDDALPPLLGRVGSPIGGGKTPIRYGLTLEGGRDSAGSPVVAEDGKVIGVLTDGRAAGELRPDYVITPIRYGLALLPPGAAPARDRHFHKP